MNSPIQKILVYIDGTEQSITAAQYAVCLALSTGAKLHALYVINTRALNELVKSHIFLSEEQQEYQQDLEGDAEQYLKHIRELAAQKGVEVSTGKVSGTVNQEILKFVKENEIDLLVLGELSSVKSRRDMFYDEAERAMRSSMCSVLIVKDEDRVWELFDSMTGK